MAGIAIAAAVGFVVGAGVNYAQTGDVGKSFQAGFKGGVTGAIAYGFGAAAAGGIGAGAYAGSQAGQAGQSAWQTGAAGGSSFGAEAGAGMGTGYTTGTGASAGTGYSGGALSGGNWNVSTEGGFTPAASTNAGAWGASNYSVAPIGYGAASTGVLGSGVGWGDIGKMALLAVGSSLLDRGDAPTIQVQVPEYQPLNYPTPEPMRLLAETTPDPEPEPPPEPEPEPEPPPLLGVPISAQPGVFGPREPSAAEVVALNEARETREAAQRKQETEEELGGIRFLAARDVAIDPFARRRRPRTALERFSGVEPTLGAPYSTYA